MWTLNSILNKYCPAILRIIQYFTAMEWFVIMATLILILWFID